MAIPVPPKGKLWFFPKAGGEKGIQRLLDAKDQLDQVCIEFANCEAAGVDGIEVNRKDAKVIRELTSIRKFMRRNPIIPDGEWRPGSTHLDRQTSKWPPGTVCLKDQRLIRQLLTWNEIPFMWLSEWRSQVQPLTGHGDDWSPARVGILILREDLGRYEAAVVAHARAEVEDPDVQLRKIIQNH